MAPQGVPKESPKPHPPGNFAVVALCTTCMLCVLFILWRRAQSLRSVVSHQLKTWIRPEGHIRLSEDDGRPARDFVDNEEEAEGDDDDDAPLALRVAQIKMSATSASGGPRDPERMVVLGS